MVRTPLARRIDTDQDLNAVHCILPKFDQAAVEEIAERFKVGNEETLTAGTAVIVTPVELARTPTFVLHPAAANAPTSGATDQMGSDGFRLASVDETTAQYEPTPAPAPAGAGVTSTRSADYQEPAERDLFADPAPVDDLTAAAATSVFDVIAALPSYTIPRRTLRSPVARLTQMAMLLAGEYAGVTIDAQAPLKARAGTR